MSPVECLSISRLVIPSKQTGGSLFTSTTQKYASEHDPSSTYDSGYNQVIETAIGRIRSLGK